MSLEWMNGQLESALEAAVSDGIERYVNMERLESFLEAENGMEKSAEQEKVFGNPEKDMENWHFQSEENSCVVSCQEFVAEQLLGGDFSEQKMIEYAGKRGWYDPGEGTSAGDTGKLLEEMGLQVERRYQTTLEQAIRELETGAKVICGVNNMVLDRPALANRPDVSGNHVVQMIGIDYSDPKQSYVILNDPGVLNGRGRMVRLDTFMKAWKTAGNYAVIARKEGNA